MVEFDLTDEQRLLQKTAHEFAEREMRPVALEYDKKGTVPWDVIKKAHALGLDTAFIPEAYGGGGIDSALTHVVVNEELNWGCAGMATGLIGAGLAYLPIIHMGTEEQKKRFLTRFTGKEARLGGHRNRTSGLRVRARLLAQEEGVRHADREEAGDRVHARGHEDKDRGRTTSHVARRVDARSRNADEQGGEHREAVRGRHGDGRHDGRGADPRRRGLHERRAGGEVDAGREDLPDLGRDLSDPAARHLPRRDRGTLGFPGERLDLRGFLEERSQELAVLALDIEVLGELFVRHREQLREMGDSLLHEEIDVFEACDRIGPLRSLADCSYPLLQLHNPSDDFGIRPYAQPDLRKGLQRLRRLLGGVRRGHPLAVGEVEHLRRRPIVRLDEVVHPLLAGDLDQVRLAHLTDVMIDRLRREPELRRNLAHRHLLRPEKIDDPSPCFVREELKCFGALDDLECLHWPPPEQCMFVLYDKCFYN